MGLHPHVKKVLNRYQLEAELRSERSAKERKKADDLLRAIEKEIIDKHARSVLSEEIRRLEDKREEKSFDLARELQGYAPELVDELIGLVRQKKAPQVKVRAIQEAFDRGFGKPNQSVDTGVTIIWDIKTGRKAKNDSQ